MPKPSFSLQTTIAASAEKVFDNVSELTRHGEWAANDLTVTAESDGAPQLGSRYASSAEVGSLHFEANLTITAFERPSKFAFSGEDKTGRFHHTFTFERSGSNTTVTRKIQFDLTPIQYLMYLLLYFPVRLPAGRKAMDNLKAQLEM